MKRHFTKLAIGFAVAWKVWLPQKIQELSDNEQEDVVDSEAAQVYCLGGTEAPETRVN